jgi:dual specificity tyrosine-phosphorylation-regulated kinase 2/3/4
MWSFGCMMYELYIGYPLFPSESEAELLHSIMEVKNIPPKYLIEVCRFPYSLERQKETFIL